jgi:hypothetical protein
MPQYYINEAVFSLPERGFVDRTLHRLESPSSGVDPVGVEMRRRRMERDESLRQLVDAELAENAAKVSGFTIVEDAEVEIDGIPAIVLRARMRARDEVYHQRQAHVVLDETWISLVVGAPHAEREACDRTFERITRSLEWRRR